MSGVNPLGQSDEDFLNSPPPVVEPEEKSAEQIAQEEAATAEAAALEEANDAKAEEDQKQEEKPADENADADNQEDKAEANPLNEADDKLTTPPVSDLKDEKDQKSDDGKSAEGSNAGSEAAEGKKPEAGKDGDKASDPADKAKEADDSAEGFSVPKTFKANGKDIELRNPEEALKLMQMGANFTRKMQEIAPHRKILMMLQDNKLLDEGKLSFYIDLENKNPEAIKKFIKDSGINLNEIDLDSDSNYIAGNNLVSDDEASFRTVADDVTSDPAGKETVAVINTTWDTVSKEVLWKEPELLKVMHEQRQSGIYAQITAEIDRQRALGQIPASTPFLSAYKAVGEKMVADVIAAAESEKTNKGQEGSGAEGGKAAEAEQKPNPVATRAASPKPAIANGDKAAAASSTRSTPETGKKVPVNPLSMDDDTFLKQMSNRV